MIDLDFKYKDLLHLLKSEAPFTPETAIILGSGLGDFAKSVKIIKTILTASLPGYPPSTIAGHEGKIHFAEHGSKKLLLFQGRIHFYEGYRLSECVLPVHIAKSFNCKNLLITNAAGGVNVNFKPGDLMLVKSINGTAIKKEFSVFTGLASEEAKKNMLNFPSPRLNKILKKAALEEKIELKEGVYWYSKGPSYETPAEIKMIGKFGGDAVGMSTVHEAMYAGACGIDISVVSCVTNYAAGITKQKLSHADVTETANLVKGKFEKLFKKAIEMT